MTSVSSAEDFEARILLVVDDPEARARLERLLTTRWSVTLAGRGDAARDAALAAPFDLVIAKVKMPGPGTGELARQLRSERSTRDVALIVVSDRCCAAAAAANDNNSEPWMRAQRVLEISMGGGLVLTGSLMVDKVRAGLVLFREWCGGAAKGERQNYAQQELRTAGTTHSRNYAQ